MKKALFALTIVASFTSQALATDKWLDTNTAATTDSGIANGATINWTTGTSNWNTNSTGLGGAISVWTSGTADRAFFAAGADTVGKAYTVNLGSALTAGAVFVEEGTVTKTGAALTVQTIDVTSGGFFITSSGALTVAAGGTTTLNGTTATYGNANPSSGGSFFGNSTANANMKIVLNGGGTLSAGGATQAIITIYDGANKITGTGPLVIAGTGKLRINNTGGNDYTGATIINGALQMSGAANTLPTGTALTINSGGVLDLQISQTVASLDGAGTLAATSSNQLTIGGTATTVYSGIWSGGRLAVNNAGGVGSLTLTNVNTSTGRFTMTNGAATVNAAASLGGDTMDLVVNGGTLTLKQAAEKVENLGGTGGSLVLNNASLSLITDPLAAAVAADNTFAGTISGAGGITKQNVLAGATVKTLILSGTNTYDGVTIISGGKIQANNASALGSDVGNTQVASGAELLFDGAANNFTIAEPIQIAGGGAGDGGAIAVQNSAKITMSGAITLSAAATITVAGTSTTALTSTVTGLNTNLTLQGGAGTSPLGIGTISGAIDLGTGSLTKLQGGTWVLSGTNSYSGVTNISAGTLSVSSVNDNLGSNTTVNIGSAATGANLTYTGTGETTGKVINLAGTTGGTFLIQSGTGNLKYTSDLTATGIGAKTLTLQGSTAGTGEISGKIVDSSSGVTSLTKSGSGTWTLSGANTYGGTTTISAGTLKSGAAGVIPDGSAVTLANVATANLDLNNNSETIGSLAGGGTTGGNVQLGSANLTVGDSTTTSYGGVISGAGKVTKQGAGTLVLTNGNNNYGGGTDVNGGTLKANNTPGAGSSATGSGAVTVNTGGTLAGSGAISGPVSISSGGNLSPGNSVESLAVGALSFSAGSTFVYETDSSASFSAGADLVNVALAGAVSIDPTTVLSVSDLAATPVSFSGAKFTLISYDKNVGLTGTFAGLSQGSTVTIGLTDFFIDYADTSPGYNFDAPAAGGSFNYVTLTAVPEASTVLFGGLVGIVAGFYHLRRKFVAGRVCV